MLLVTRKEEGQASATYGRQCIAVLLSLASSQQWVLTHMYSVTGALLTVWAVAGRLASLP